MAVCVACRAMFPDEFRYCPGCGAPSNAGTTRASQAGVGRVSLLRTRGPRTPLLFAGAFVISLMLVAISVVFGSMTYVDEVVLIAIAVILFLLPFAILLIALGLNGPEADGKSSP